MLIHIRLTSTRSQARTAYKRCIAIPIADVERVKNDWDDFERSRKSQNKGEVITKAILELVSVALKSLTNLVFLKLTEMHRSGPVKRTALIEFKWPLPRATLALPGLCFRISAHLALTLSMVKWMVGMLKVTIPL